MDLGDYCWASQVLDLSTHIPFNNYGEFPPEAAGEKVRVPHLHCECEAYDG
jgi:hypothetical protein